MVFFDWYHTIGYHTSYHRPPSERYVVHVVSCDVQFQSNWTRHKSLRMGPLTWPGDRLLQTVVHGDLDRRLHLRRHLHRFLPSRFDLEREEGGLNGGAAHRRPQKE